MIKLLRLNHFSLSLLILFCVTNIQADETTFKSHLPFKEGIIHYKITGTQAGSQTTYIRNYGLEQTIYKKTYATIMHEESYSDEIIMITPEWTYRINLKTKEATKEFSLAYLFLEKFNALSPKEQAMIFKQKSVKHLGLDTVKLSLDGFTYHISKEGFVPLLSKAKILGYKSHIEAEEIALCLVDDKHFVLPEGLKITQIHPLPSRASQMIEALLKESSK